MIREDGTWLAAIRVDGGRGAATLGCGDRQIFFEGS